VTPAALRASRPFLLVLAVLGGCGPAPNAPAPTSNTASGDPVEPLIADPSLMDDLKPQILQSVLTLIREAATNPGGPNFNIATENLNGYFQSTPESGFALDPQVRTFLGTQRILEPLAQEIVRPKFVAATDGRHIEDSILYSSIAQRVAGDGEPLDRVTRVFDWVVNQVGLVPAGSLRAGNGLHAQVRPFDALLRGMAVESGDWAERAWLFMVLCRQLGVDVGFLTYAAPSRGPTPRSIDQIPDTNVAWACTALIDGKLYLFDARIGIPIPGPGGIATFDDVIRDPQVLATLDWPDSPYVTNQPELAAAKIRVLIESTPACIAPRMKLLQNDLAGKNRMIVYRDPSDVAAKFQQALGERCEKVELWTLPMNVQYRLFHDGAFVQATQFHLQFFDQRWPLLAARMQHLLGELKISLEKFVSFRFADDTVQADGALVSPDIQRVLDLFSTYFLAMVQRDRGDLAQAEFLFKETLRLLPKPARGQPYFCMLRWGAATNLGRIYLSQGKHALAVRYLSEESPTTQSHGNLFQARELIWRDPFVPPADTPPVVKPPEELPPLRAMIPPPPRNQAPPGGL
jgi:hypothetical protein